MTASRDISARVNTPVSQEFGRLDREVDGQSFADAAQVQLTAGRQGDDRETRVAPHASVVGKSGDDCCRRVRPDQLKRSIVSRRLQGGKNCGIKDTVGRFRCLQSERYRSKETWRRLKGLAGGTVERR